MNVYKTTSRNYRTISQGDPDWCFKADNITAVPRASIEISKNCPDQYKSILSHFIEMGFIKLVANIPEREYMWEKLQS